MGRWVIDNAYLGSEHLERLLRNGWEPFAAETSSEGAGLAVRWKTMVWLKKLVPGPAQEES